MTVKCKTGLFANGPAELMKVYEEVLNKYGLQAWLLQNDVRLP
ncbi:hypothetical protein [Niallia circulans]|nr:hypothetical protein [Niallia circulans]